jgi:uracil-DNA glycosylase family 4
MDGVASLPSPLEDFNIRLTACERCPRLREYCAEVARTRRRAYASEEYWGRPVPSFGDPAALVLVLGLAPGAHGSNRTGRPFTGDGSGLFLFPVLHETGFASQPQALSRLDGLQLRGMWISAVVRCAPPGNKPTLEEQRSCAPWLDEEIALLNSLRVVVCLGKIAFDGFIGYCLRHGLLHKRSEITFTHGAEFTLGGLTLLASYHPSLQNTNTGTLTRPMFVEIFRRARLLAGLRD